MKTHSREVAAAIQYKLKAFAITRERRLFVEAHLAEAIREAERDTSWLGTTKLRKLRWVEAHPGAFASRMAVALVMEQVHLTCHCGRTAIYRNGQTGYCAKHRDDARTARNVVVARYDTNRGDNEKAKAERDTNLLGFEHLRMARRRRK